MSGALLLRLIFLGSRTVLTGDEIHYAEALQRFMGGRFVEGISDYWAFIYPLAAVPFGLAAGGAELGLRLLSVASGTAVVVPCMLLAGRLWGERAALFTGALIALHPNLVSFSTSAMTEPLYSFLLISSLYVFFLHVRDGGRLLFPLALLLALASLARMEAVFFFLPVVVMVLIGLGDGGRTAPLKVRAGRAAVVIAVFAAAAFSQALLIHMKTGMWSVGSKASINLSSPLVWEDSLERERYVYSLNEEGTARRIDEVGLESPVKVLWRQRKAVASLYFRKMNRGFAITPLLLSSPFLLLLVPLGIFGRGWNGDRLMELLLLALGIIPFLVYSVFRVQIRYLVPFLPIYLMWAARGCEVLSGWIERNVSPRPIWRVSALFLVFASLVPFTIRGYSGMLAGQPAEYRKIGAWIRDRAGFEARVLAHPGCPVSYYAGEAEATFIPWTDVPGLLRYARQRGFDYLLVEEDYFRAYRPGLVRLLGSGPNPGLERVQTFEGRRGGKILLYSILPES